MGAVKSSIVDFVARVTKEGGADFVPVPERIATFDNDGTLWTEQPFYFQLAFAIDRDQGDGAAAPGMEEQAAVQGAAGRRQEDAGGGRQERPAAAHRRHAYRHDDGGFRQDRDRLDRRPRGIRASTGLIPNWCSSRCSNYWPICAPTASRRSSCPAAASNSCGRGRSASTAFRRSRWSARPAR